MDDRPILATPVEELWEDLARTVMPGAPRAQYIEMRKMFYAGMRTMMEANLELASLNMEQSLASAILAMRYNELKAFFEPGGGVYEEP